MKIKQANGKTIVKISRKEWDRIGQQQGWVKQAAPVAPVPSPPGSAPAPAAGTTGITPGVQPAATINKPVALTPEGKQNDTPASQQLNMLDRQVQQVKPLLRGLGPEDMQLAQLVANNLQGLIADIQAATAQVNG